MYGLLQRIVAKLKIQHGALESVLVKDLEQATDYVGRVGVDEARLVIFNRDPDTNWGAKTWQRQEQLGALPIGVWGA